MQKSPLFSSGTWINFVWPRVHFCFDSLEIKHWVLHSVRKRRPFSPRWSKDTSAICEMGNFGKRVYFERRGVVLRALRSLLAKLSSKLTDRFSMDGGDECVDSTARKPLVLVVRGVATWLLNVRGAAGDEDDDAVAWVNAVSLRIGISFLKFSVYLYDGGDRVQHPPRIYRDATVPYRWSQKHHAWGWRRPLIWAWHNCQQ